MYLERFSQVWAPLQAYHATQLVNRNVEYLKSHRERTFARYSDYRHALHNVVRLTGYSDEFNPYLIKESSSRLAPAIGMATIVMNQAVSFTPENGRNEPETSNVLHGFAVDYWIGHRSRSDNIGATTALIEQANKLHIKSGESGRPNVFTVESEHARLPIGFRGVLKQISDSGMPVEYATSDFDPNYAVIDPSEPTVLFAKTDKFI